MKSEISQAITVAIRITELHNHARSAENAIVNVIANAYTDFVTEEERNQLSAVSTLLAKLAAKTDYHAIYRHVNGLSD